MKILVFTPCIPDPFGRDAHQRTFHLLRALAKDHEVDLLALSGKGENPENQAAFEDFCQQVEFIPFEHSKWQRILPSRLFNPLPSNVAQWAMPHVAQALARRLAQNDYDLVHVCDIVLAQYFLKAHREIPIVVDRRMVDLKSQFIEQGRPGSPLESHLLRYENYTKLWLYERKIAHRAALEVVCSHGDEDFLHRRVSRQTSVEVIENGVDIDYFRPDTVSDVRADRPSILFCGDLDCSPDIDALRWYFEGIHDRLRARVPELRVLIAGKAPVREVKAHGSRPGVTVAGGVRDFRPYYRQSWLQIVPLQIGGGTRLKIVESMATGTPVVSTSIGARDLGLCDREEILIADSQASFAELTSHALEDSVLRARIEEKGLSAARCRFQWPMLGRRLSEIYERTLAQRPGVSCRKALPQPA